MLILKSISKLINAFPVLFGITQAPLKIWVLGVLPLPFTTRDKSMAWEKKHFLHYASNRLCLSGLLVGGLIWIVKGAVRAEYGRTEISINEISYTHKPVLDESELLVLTQRIHSVRMYEEHTQVCYIF